MIFKGLTVRNVIGRRIFETWSITKKLLETKDNGIHDKIWEIILNGGKGTIQNIESFDPEKFEKKLLSYPKILVKW